MAKLIIQELDQRKREARTLKFDAFPVTIGRSFSNDVILSDAYVCPSHAYIDQAEEGWRIYNQQSKNGVYIQNRKEAVDHAAPIFSGDVLVVGKTHLRVLSPDHQVPESKRIKPPQAKRSQWPIPVMAWALALVVVCLLAIDLYLEIGDEKLSDDFLEGAIAISVFLAMIMLWSAGWAFVGRVLKNRPLFHHHLLMASASVVLIEIGWYLNRFIRYNTCNANMGELINTLLPLVVIGTLFALSIRFATRIPVKSIFLTSGIIVTLIASIFLYAKINDRSKFKSSPEFEAVLLAPWAQLAHGRSLEQFMQENEALFQELEK